MSDAWRDQPRWPGSTPGGGHAPGPGPGRWRDGDGPGAGALDPHELGVLGFMHTLRNSIVGEHAGQGGGWVSHRAIGPITAPGVLDRMVGKGLLDRREANGEVFYRVNETGTGPRGVSPGEALEGQVLPAAPDWAQRISGGVDAPQTAATPPMPDRESSRPEIAAWARAIGPEGARREVVVSLLGGPGAADLRSYGDEHIAVGSSSPEGRYADGDYGLIRRQGNQFEALTIEEYNPYGAPDIGRSNAAHGELFDSQDQANIYLWRWGQTIDGARARYNESILGHGDSLMDMLADDPDYADDRRAIGRIMRKIRKERDRSPVAWDRAVDELVGLFLEFETDPYDLPDPVPARES